MNTMLDDCSRETMAVPSGENQHMQAKSIYTSNGICEQ